MNETSLRWKGRLGSLKALAALVLLIAVILLINALNDLSLATSNPTTPENVKIGRLVKGELGTNRYVSVSGLALYSEFYKETEDGRTVSQYFFIVDEDTGDMVLVKSTDKLPVIEREEQATLSGMTRSTASKLRTLVESDFVEMRQAGVQTSATLYLAEGEKPANVTQAAVLAGGLLLLSVLCVATFFFPTTVFGPAPIDSAAASAAIGDPGVKLTGRFVQVASLQPSIQLGRKTRQFTNAIGNVLTPAQHQLMLYIHHVLVQRVYGFKVSEKQSDWGIPLDSGRLIDATPGKIYGWRDRWAVRLRYHDEASKPQAVLVSFNHAGAQAQFVDLLRQLGFAVETGDAPLF